MDSLSLGIGGADSSLNMVVVRDAYKTYRNRLPIIGKYFPKTSEDQVVLDGLCMTVPRSTIYTLLGPSGCGKTTLLNCIVGTRKLDSGTILVGVKSLRDIGYMPQEISLSMELSIKENIVFYCHLYNIDKELRLQRELEIHEVLQIPPGDRIINTLSGGQQRMVSFFIALLHSPELLILDEPTVGLDPMISERMWKYLVKLSDKENRTTIITTHYIEEARKANTVAMMRKGVILEEGNPQQIMDKYYARRLSYIFTQLSKEQSTNAANNLFLTGSNIRPQFSQKNQKDRMALAPLTTSSGFSMLRCRSHMYKNWCFLKRVKWGTIFAMLILPVMQCTLYYYAIGADPKDLRIGIVNDELRYNMNEGCKWSNASCSLNTTNHWLSCRLEDTLKKQGPIMVHYDDEESARKSVEDNDIWAYVYIPQNFSWALLNRFENRKTASQFIEMSEIIVHMDESNQLFVYFMNKKLQNGYMKFVKELFIDCGWKESAANLPIKMMEPIYGSESYSFTEFTQPTIMVLSSYFLPIIYIIVAYGTEKRENLKERSIVAGMTFLEILAGHFFMSLIILAIQVVLMMFQMFVILNNILNGSPILYLIFLYFIGVSGICYGIFIGNVSDSEYAAVFMASGSFFPYTLISGMFWPIEGMHYMMKTVSWMFPLTLSTEALRCVALKGWGITHPVVYYGILSTVAWIIINLLTSIVVIKLRKN